MRTGRVIAKRERILSCLAHAFSRKASVGRIEKIGSHQPLKVGHTRRIKSRKLCAAQHQVSKVDVTPSLPPVLPCPSAWR